MSMVREELSNLVKAHAGTDGEDTHTEALLAEATIILPLPPELSEEAIKNLGQEEILDKLYGHAEALYDRREKEIGSEAMRSIEKLIMLRVVDSQWINHLTDMDQQRLQAGWAGLQQQKSVDAYKNLGSQQWDILKDNIQRDVAEKIFHVNIVRQEAVKPPLTPMVKAVARAASGNQPLKAAGNKTGRNDPCPCGSGKKYKHCHGQ
jgi:preprotein translocase subunit SecA